MNPRTTNEANEVPDPHPCSLNTNQINSNEKDKDYEALVNCCQRHVCTTADIVLLKMDADLVFLLF
jgi:hypothetical protein